MCRSRIVQFCKLNPSFEEGGERKGDRKRKRRDSVKQQNKTNKGRTRFKGRRSQKNTEQGIEDLIR